MDGEGSFGFHNYHGGFKVNISASSTDKESLDRLVRLYGGRLYVHKKPMNGWKGSWIWRIAARAEAVSFLSCIEPFLRLKRQRARLIQHVLRWRQNFYDLSAAERKRLTYCVAAMRNANRRGS